MANNDKLFKTIRLVVMCGSILVAVTLAYASLNERVTQNIIHIETITTKAETNEKTIIGIKRDIEYIKEGIDDIKEELKSK